MFFKKDFRLWKQKKLNPDPGTLNRNTTATGEIRVGSVPIPPRSYPV